MSDEQILQQAIRLLLDAAPGARVILFGSHARDKARLESDLDFLVIEPEVKDRMGEMARLATVLAPLMIPADVLVVSAERFAYWKDTPNTVYNRAVREGKIYEIDWAERLLDTEETRTTSSTTCGGGSRPCKSNN